MVGKQHITLHVEGMTCESCARHVREALLSIAGVDDVQVSDWRSGRAVVVADTIVRTEDLSRAIRKAGYRAVVEQGLEEEAEGPIGCCC
jgi:mercuric reductase